MNKRIAASTLVVAAGLGFAGFGAAAVAQAHPAPPKQEPYDWCPGQPFNYDYWGPNWDATRCHDAHWYPEDPRDLQHFHGGPASGGIPFPPNGGIAPR